MSMTRYFSKLYQEKRELALVGWAYFAMMIVSVVIAIVTFAVFNESLGVGILIVPMVAMVAISMNVVAWTLIKIAATMFLPKKGKGKPTGKR